MYQSINLLQFCWKRARGCGKEHDPQASQKAARRRRHHDDEHRGHAHFHQHACCGRRKVAKSSVRGLEAWRQGQEQRAGGEAEGQGGPARPRTTRTTLVRCTEQLMGAGKKLQDGRSRVWSVQPRVRAF